MEDKEDGSSNNSENVPSPPHNPRSLKGGKCNGMIWWKAYNLQHRYLIDASNVKRNGATVSLPVPISTPHLVQQYQKYRDIFKPKPQLDSRLKHYRNLFAKTNQKKVYKKWINHHDVAVLPQYVIDTASGAFDDNVDKAWCYSGGNLDLMNMGGETVSVYSGFHQAVTVMNLETKEECTLGFKEILPIYNIKSQGFNSNLFLARQKSKVIVFQVLSDPFDVTMVWRGKSKNSFVDCAFNEYRKNEITTVDVEHNVKVRDFVQNKERASNYIETEFKKVPDCFAQVFNIDANRTVVINRCCLYIVDWRSQDAQQICLNQSWLKCDDLCSVFSNYYDENILYISSAHSVYKFDLRRLAYTNKTMHMLSSAPFISTCSNIKGGDVICLSGQTHSDKVLVFVTPEAITTPIHIPTARDALHAVALTNHLENLHYLENRVALPILGMKLYDNTLYTLNTVEDLFEQTINSEENNGVEKALEWFKSVPYKPKPLEITAVRNLNHITNAVTKSFSEKYMSKALATGRSFNDRLDKEYETLKKCLEGGVGEAMNAIWDVDTLLPESEDVSTKDSPAKSKVREWLDAMR